MGEGQYGKVELWGVSKMASESVAVLTPAEIAVKISNKAQVDSAHDVYQILDEFLVMKTMGSIRMWFSFIT